MFIDAVVKIQSNRENELNDSEKTCVKMFLKKKKVGSDVVEAATTAKSLAQTVELSIESVKFTSLYINLDWIPPTSNMVERLFSRCKFVMTLLRNSMSPITFKEVMFLKMNEENWDEKTVQLALRKHRKKAKANQ